VSAEDLSISGNLEEATVPELIRGIVRGADSAVLVIEGDGSTNTVCFKDGRLVFASTTDPDLRLPELFLRTGQIDVEKYQEAAQRATGKNPGAVLCELGYIGPDELVRGVEKQVREIIVRIFNWRAGSYHLTFGGAFPRDMIVLQLPTDRVILDGISKIDRWSRISSGIRDIDATIRRTPGQDSRLYNLELTEEEHGIFNLCDAPFTVRELCRMSYLSDFETCRVVWGLLCVNLLEEVRPEGAQPAAQARGGIAPLVANFNTAYTAMYRIVFGRIGEEIQDFVATLVAGLPPESAHLLRGIDLTEGGRVDAPRFEANLQAEHPGNVDTMAQDVLNELLYQWILQVRQQFGSDLEREVTTALNSMKQG
jgi:hypothetical protein